MKAPAGALALAILCGAGCVSTSAEHERVSVLAPVPPDVRSVVVQALPMKAGSMKHVEGLTNAPQLFAQSIRDALKRRQPAWQIDVADSTGAAPAGDLVIVTELLEVDGGSAGSRFWIGFGAGKARSTATVSIRDREGKDLATASISEVTTCPVGGCTESNEVLVQTNLKDLGEEAAAFVASPVEFRQRAKSEPH